MIGYVTLGTNNIVQSVKFYDQVLAIIGCEKVYDFESFVGWKVSDDGQMFAVVKPYDGEPASAGNGAMVALKATDQTLVERAYAKALALGGTSEGEPGLRQGNYYCAYCRDLDGNKLNFYCLVQALA